MEGREFKCIIQDGFLNQGQLWDLKAGDRKESELEMITAHCVRGGTVQSCQPSAYF